MKDYTTSNSLKFLIAYIVLIAIGVSIPYTESQSTGLLIVASVVGICTTLLPVYAIIDTHLKINKRIGLSFKNAFMSGFLIAAVVGILTGIKTFAYQMILGFANLTHDIFEITALTLLVYLAFVLVAMMFEGQWKIFSKAGKPGWASIVPIYNIIVMLEIVGKPTYWIIFFLIPFVNIFFAIWVTNLLSKSYGKEVDFTLGMIFLPFIFYPLLGLGDDQYEPEFINA